MQPTPIQAAAQAALTPPPVGHPWPDQGGIYAGIAREADGSTHHLILCPLLQPKRLTWKAAKEWAAALVFEGHSDFTLFTRREGALLYATLFDLVEIDDWHWTSTEYSERNAWFQYFHDGRQGHSGKSYEARARAVRRLPLSPSILSVTTDAAEEEVAA